MWRTTCPLVAISFAIATTVSCSSQPHRDPRAPVSGRVTYDGQPVTAGRIMFYPEDGRRMAIGVIDAEGNYTLTTYVHNDGAFLGQHRVVIDAVREISVGPTSIDEEVDGVEAEVERLVPAIYADRKSTPLVAEVKDEVNTIDFKIPR